MQNNNAPGSDNKLAPFTISAAVPSCLSLSPSDFLASRPHLQRLMAGVMVFRMGTSSQCSQLQTLLIRRAATDSYPLKWERPAGAVSSSDTTVLDCAVRELWEETGLRASHIECPVGITEILGEELEGWGINPEVERAELEVGDEAQTIGFWDAGTKWGIVTVIVDVEENVAEDGVEGKTVVRLSPEEHEEYMWATEAQVRSGKDQEGRTMEYTSRAVWHTILEGFRLKREMNAFPPVKSIAAS